MKLREIAEKISVYLARFEKNPEINVERESARGAKLPPYYNAGAYAAGRYVRIRYISFQGAHHLTKPEAAAYLDRLDHGFVGKHFEGNKP